SARCRRRSRAASESARESRPSRPCAHCCAATLPRRGEPCGPPRRGCSRCITRCEAIEFEGRRVRTFRLRVDAHGDPAAAWYRGGIMASLLIAHPAVDSADEHRDLVPETRADSTETDQLRDSTCRVAGSLLDNFSNEPKLLRVRYLSPLATFAV